MRRTLFFTRLAAFAAMAFFVRLLVAAAQPPPPPFVVVIHPSNPNRVLSRRFVGDTFLKKTTRWPDGDVIHPVDLVPDSATREAFSQDVLKRSVAEVKSYWQQIIFSGRDVPPPELSDDDAVLKFVATHAGAIGYVSGKARLGEVKPVVLE